MTIRLIEIAEPATPPSGRIWLYADSVDSLLKAKDDTGTVTVLGGEIGSASVVVVCRNVTGGSLAAGTVVYINGTDSNLPTIAKAQANSASTSKRTFGILVNSLADSTNGNVIMIGLLSNQDTSAFIAGDLLYLSSSVAGGMQNTQPVQPLHSVFLGVVTRSHISLGTIAVSIQNGFDVTDLHDVLISSIQDGQILQWDNAASLWKNAYKDSVWSTEATTGVINNLAITTNAVRFTGAAPFLRGIVAKSDGTEIVLYNATGGVLTIQAENGTSTAANRFTHNTNSTISVQNGQGVRYKYSTATSRWLLADQFAIAGTAPVTVSANNVISMANSSASVNGYLSSANFTTFNAKVGGTGAAARVAYWTNSTTIDDDANLTWNAAKSRMGVQVTAGSEAAAMHMKSTVAIPLVGLNTFTANLVEFVPLNAPAPTTPVQIAGRIMNPDAPSASENASGATSWVTGDIITHRIVPYHYDGDVTYTECATYTETTPVTLAADFNGVDLSWTPDTTGSLAIAGYNIYRDVNGSGFTEGWDVGAVASYVDDQTGNVINGYPSLPQFPDYVADGTVRGYEYWAKKVFGNDSVFNTTAATDTLTDDNTGKPYLVTHEADVDPGNTVYLVGAADGVSYTDYIEGVDATPFTEGPSSWTTGAVASPDTYGTISDGNIWNRDYAGYKTELVNGLTIYSPASSASLVDPNDSLRYYAVISMTWANPSTGAKVINGQDLNGFEVIGGTSATVYDNIGSFNTDNIVSPQGIIPPGMQIDKAGDTLDFAHLTIKGLADFAKIDFTDSTDAVQGTVASSATELSLQFAATKNVRVKASQLGVYGVAPVARATTAGAASTFVANTSGIVDNTATFDGYSIGQIVKALRNIGILT